ncbi:MAG: FeoB-associated Cys-rich membrane protein [Salinivirgaceae bacterium]|nr:FeoB-associated Cys-rich membrane protein [Salinivirgaceae bacterium]
MNSTIQTIIVALICVVAIGVAGRKLLRTINGKNSCSHCNGNCSMCDQNNKAKHQENE